MPIFLLLLLLVSGPAHAQAPTEPQAEAPKTPEDQEKNAEIAEQLEKMKGDLSDEPFKIVVEGKIDLNYVFAESPDSFVVNYKFHMEGLAKNKVDLVKGKGEITTGINGFLAKWPTGECALNISVGDIPFEMVFNKIAEEQVHVDIRIVGDISENWESNCTFIDAPGSKFHTSGTPEKWVIRALKRPVPSFTDLTIPIDRLHKLTSTLKFQIEQFLIPDPPLGSAELKGSGTIQIMPATL